MGLRLRRQPAASREAGREPPDDEDAIVLRALVDRRAFVPLYETHFAAIYRHCHRRLGEKEAAEDLTALVFRKALERLHSFHGGSLKAWLFTIADNALRDAARAARRRREPIGTGARPGGAGAGGARPAAAAPRSGRAAGGL